MMTYRVSTRPLGHGMRISAASRQDAALGYLQSRIGGWPTTMRVWVRREAEIPDDEMAVATSYDVERFTFKLRGHGAWERVADA